MKDIKKWLVEFTISLVILYLTVSFVAWEFNPSEWRWFTRLPFVIVLAVIGICIAPEVDENKIKDAAKATRILAQEARNKISDLFDDKVKKIKK